MTHPLRIEFEGGLHHVTARENRQEAIFVCNDDREAFLKLLGKVITLLDMPRLLSDEKSLPSVA